MAQITGDAEDSARLASLTEWAQSPEVQAAMVRDPNADVAERDRQRWARNNSYSADLAAWRDRQP
jgi:hypothetical protein